MSNIVTKPKNAGRIEAGRKLVEWNRNNKQKLTQEPMQVLTQEPTQVLNQEPNQVLNQEPSTIKSEYLYAVGVLIAIGLAIYKFKSVAVKTLQKSQTGLSVGRTIEKKIHDPFFR